MWWIFTASPPKPVPPEHVILEDFVQYPIDADYAAVGEKEGWLRFVGYHSLAGVTYFEWEHTRRR